MSNRKRLLSVFGDFKTVQHIDNDRPSDLIVEEIQDCEPIIEAAKRLSDESHQRGEIFRHVGFIPHFVFNQASREGWLHDPVKWKRWLNDPDNKAFRTWPGRI